MGWWASDEPRRTGAVIGVVLAASAVVGLGVGLLLGVAGGGGHVDVGAASPSVGTPTTSAPATPTPTTRTRAASQIEKGLTHDIGYLVAARREDDGRHVTFDRVILKTGKAAKAYAKQYHKKPPGPDGVLLVNDNPLTRDLVLSPDVTVMGAMALAGSQEPKPVPLQSLLDAIDATDANGSNLLLDLTYDKLGYVVRIQEHDLP